MTTDATPMPKFDDMGLSAPILQGLEKLGYESPSPIQARMIPHVLDGHDVIGQAQTGTGKTAAFALPLLSNLDLGQKDPQVLVLTPTRELAIQVAEAFQRYAAKLKGFNVLPIYGGADYGAQFRQLKRGAHVIVGTPGRLMDHIRRETLKLGSLKCLVLDEADEMLRMGFIDDVEWIMEKTPSGRQVALFSATMPPVIRRIAQKHLTDPKEVTIESKGRAADTIRQRHWMVSGHHKLDALTRVLECEEFDGMIVFVRTKNATSDLADRLQARGFAATALNGDIAQSKRERIISQLKSGRFDILVATDVAARGLDVDRISHVVNYDIPYDVEGYVHRIGRTGRAGRKGDAILFVAPREKRMLYAIERATKTRIELMEMPTNETINNIRIAKFKQQVTDTLAKEGLDLFRQILDDYRQEHNIPSLEIAAALAKLVQGDEPLLLEKKPRRERVGGDERPERGRRYEDRDVERRGGREGRPPRELKPPEKGMERYRIEVGHVNQVRPGSVVGAIANEAGLDGQHIGRITIYDDYSTVDLPEGMPRETLSILRKTRVGGKPLKISLVGGKKTKKPKRKLDQNRKKGKQVDR